MNETWHFVRGLLLLIAAVALVGFVVFRAFKRSREPGTLVVKSLISMPVLGLAAMAVPWFGVFGPFVIVGCGVVLSLLWTPHLGAMLVSPLTNLFDGGNIEPEQRPLYSIAQAQRKRGNYTEAIRQIRRQLEKFPGDIEGQLLMAEIQAEHLNDLPGAELTIRRLCEQPNHPPKSIVFALNLIADWHLRFAQDRDAAKAALEEIIARFPGSEFQGIAEQRIAHLGSTEQLVAMRSPRRIVLRHGVENIGLLPAAAQPRAPEADPARLAADYVQHLADHPHDTEARERLALIYAEHYQRLDLAAAELEQLIALPGQPAKHVAHWLTVLADLQVRSSAPYEVVRQTLQRIVDRFPDTAAASTAGHRIDLLRLEMKSRQATGTVKLGTYEQDIGLKRGSPLNPRSPHQA